MSSLYIVAASGFRSTNEKVWNQQETLTSWSVTRQQNYFCTTRRQAVDFRFKWFTANTLKQVWDQCYYVSGRMKASLKQRGREGRQMRSSDCMRKNWGGARKNKCNKVKNKQPGRFFLYTRRIKDSRDWGAWRNNPLWASWGGAARRMKEKHERERRSQGVLMKPSRDLWKWASIIQQLWIMGRQAGGGGGADQRRRKHAVLVPEGRIQSEKGSTMRGSRVRVW